VNVGDVLGRFEGVDVDGAFDGSVVGNLEGDLVGLLLGVFVGPLDGRNVGASEVGEKLGIAGAWDGNNVGLALQTPTGPLSPVCGLTHAPFVHMQLCFKHSDLHGMSQYSWH
jgi:hypothetical protein